MEVLTLILGSLTIASVLGTIAATFYGVRSKTIIATLEVSNKAYAERNIQLEGEAVRKDAEYAQKLSELEGRISTLEKIKTPPLQPLMKLVQDNHAEVMKAISPKETK